MGRVRGDGRGRLTRHGIILALLLALPAVAAADDGAAPSDPEPGRQGSGAGTGEDVSEDPKAPEGSDASTAEEALPFAGTLETVVVAHREVPLSELAPMATTALPGLSDDEAQPASTLADALAAAPGVVAQNRTNYAQDLRLSIRGFGDRAAFGIRGIRVLVDGIPLTLADGQTTLEGFDLSSVSRVQVLRGPSATLYGNASGGVLLLTTESGRGPTRHGLHTELGSFGTSRLRLFTAAGDQDFSYRVSGWRHATDGYRAHAAGQRVGVSARASFRPGKDTRVTTLATLSLLPRARDPGGLSRAQVEADPTQAAAPNLEFDTGEQAAQLNLGVAAHHRLTAFQSLDAALYGLVRDFSGAIPGRTIDLGRAAGGGYVHYRNAAPVLGLRSELWAGGSLELQDDRRRNHTNVGGEPSEPLLLDQRERVWSTGVFAQETLAPWPFLAFTAGARYDRLEFLLEDRLLQDGDQSGARAFDVWTGFGGATWRPAPALRIFANVGQSFESPTTTELVNRPGGGAGLNPDLAPQKALSYEVGVRGEAAGAGLEGSASVYHIALRDELVPFEDATGRTYYRNAGRSRRDGLEVAAAWLSPALPGLSARATWTLTFARFDRYEKDGVDLSRNAVPGVPRHRVGLDAAYRPGRGPGAGVLLQYLAPMWADDENSVRSAGQFVQEVWAGYRVSLGDFALDVFVGAHNLLGLTYDDNLRINAFGGRYFEPAPARGIRGGLGLTWSPGGG